MEKLRDYVLEKLKVVADTILSTTKENMDEDYWNYNGAVLRMDERIEVYVPFDNNWKYRLFFVKEAPETDDFMLEFYIDDTLGYTYHFFYSGDRGRAFQLYVYEDADYTSKLTDKQKEKIREYVDLLSERIDTLRYDAAETQDIGPNRDLKKKNVRLKYDAAMANLEDGETVLPSVRYAVDWLADYYGEYLGSAVDAFKQVATKHLMDCFKYGYAGELIWKDSPLYPPYRGEIGGYYLKNIFKAIGVWEQIDSSKLPMCSVIVEADCVRIRKDPHEEYETITGDMLNSKKGFGRTSNN